MPKKHGGIRVSITRHVTFADIDYLVNQLKALDVNKYTGVDKKLTTEINRKDTRKSAKKKTKQFHNFATRAAAL